MSEVEREEKERIQKEKEMKEPKEMIDVKGKISAVSATSEDITEPVENMGENFAEISSPPNNVNIPVLKLDLVNGKSSTLPLPKRDNSNVTQNEENAEDSSIRKQTISATTKTPMPSPRDRSPQVPFVQSIITKEFNERQNFWRANLEAQRSNARHKFDAVRRSLSPPSGAGFGRGDIKDRVLHRTAAVNNPIFGANAVKAKLESANNVEKASPVFGSVEARVKLSVSKLRAGSRSPSPTGFGLPIGVTPVILSRDTLKDSKGQTVIKHSTIPSRVVRATSAVTNETSFPQSSVSSRVMPVASPNPQNGASSTTRPTSSFFRGFSPPSLLSPRTQFFNTNNNVSTVVKTNNAQNTSSSLRAGSAGHNPLSSYSYITPQAPFPSRTGNLNAVFPPRCGSSGLANNTSSINNSTKQSLGTNSSHATTVVQPLSESEINVNGNNYKESGKISGNLGSKNDAQSNNGMRSRGASSNGSSCLGIAKSDSADVKPKQVLTENEENENDEDLIKSENISKQDVVFNVDKVEAVLPDAAADDEIPTETKHVTESKAEDKADQEALVQESDSTPASNALLSASQKNLPERFFIGSNQNSEIQSQSSVSVRSRIQNSNNAFLTPPGGLGSNSRGTTPASKSSQAVPFPSIYAPSVGNILPSPPNFFGQSLLNANTNLSGTSNSR